MMSHWFISHASKDGSALAEALVVELETRGEACWIAPRDVLVGEPYPGQITRAILHSKAVVVLVTPGANESRDVLQEVQIAHQTQIRVTPVIVSNTEAGDNLRYFVGVRHQLKWTTPQTVADKLTGTTLEILQSDPIKPTIELEASAIDRHTQTSSAAAWSFISDSLDMSDYQSFLKLYGDCAEAILAARHLRQLEEWNTINKTDPCSIETFIAANIFGSLKTLAKAKASTSWKEIMSVEPFIVAGGTRFKCGGIGAYDIDLQSIRYNRERQGDRELIFGNSRANSPEALVRIEGWFDAISGNRNADPTFFNRRFAAGQIIARCYDDESGATFYLGTRFPGKMTPLAKLGVLQRVSDPVALVHIEI